MSAAPACEQCGSPMAAERTGGKAIGWHCTDCRSKKIKGVMQRIRHAAPRAARLSKSKSPWCVRCGKRVEKIAVVPDPRRGGQAVVEYHCHGEAVRQEMPASLVEGGLASYTAFNTYTSGLMLGTPTPPSSKKKGGKG